MRSHFPHPTRSVPTQPSLRIEDRLADEARFIKSWFDNPLITGAVSPSGRFLARMMAGYIDPQAEGPIVELGPGTGPVTQALLQRGVAARRLVLVEFDPAFCKLLSRRFPGVRVIQADAYRLGESLRGVLDEAPAAVVSSLPLLTKPEGQRLALLDDAFELMGPNGCFVQFTYGMASPMPRNVPGAAFDAEVSPAVWLNLPPARVWVYRRPAEGGVLTVEPKRPNGAQEFFDKLKIGTEKMQRDLKKEIEAAKARIRLRIDPSMGARGGRKAKPAVGLLRKVSDAQKTRRP